MGTQTENRKDHGGLGLGGLSGGLIAPAADFVLSSDSQGGWSDRYV